MPPASRKARTPKQIGNALRVERRAKGMTQTELASRAGLRQELVSKIESGRPGTAISAICALLAALDIEFEVRPRGRDAPDIEDIF